MIEAGKHTSEKAMAALSMTVEEIEEMESRPEAEPLPQIGKYGSLFLTYLRENHPGRHAFLLSETTLRDVCVKVDSEAREMMETVQSQFRAKTPKPAPGDFMAMVQYNTMIRDRSEEIVLDEIVYRPR